MPSRFSTNDIKRKFYYFFTSLACNFGWHYWRCHWSDEFHGKFLEFYLHTIHIFPHSFWTLIFFQSIQNLLIDKIGKKKSPGKFVTQIYLFCFYILNVFFLLLLKSWWYKNTILRKTDIQIYVGYDKRFKGISFFLRVEFQLMENEEFKTFWCDNYIYILAKAMVWILSYWFRII